MRIWAAILFAFLGFVSFSSKASAVVLGCDLAGNLYNVNTSNASLSLIGNTGLTGLGSIEFAADGTLYGMTAGNQAGLYRIDKTTGASTLVGAFGKGVWFDGGLAFGPDGTCYCVNYSLSVAPSLYSINLSNGVATNLGQLGTNHAITGLSWRSDGRLVAYDDITSSFIAIDPSTANIASTIGLNVSPGIIGGMTTDRISGTSYFATGAGPALSSSLFGSNSLYSFDLFTGANNYIGSFSNFQNMVAGGISGLAADPAPEPATLGLLGLGLVAVAIKRRKKLQKEM
jgi:hypothetical protein